jgi:hypothetical protein
LAKQEASGLSPSAFAEQEGLEVQRLHRWRPRLAKEAGRRVIAVATPTFVEVGSRRAARVEVVLLSGRVVSVLPIVACTVDILAEVSSRCRDRHRQTWDDPIRNADGHRAGVVGLHGGVRSAAPSARCDR